MADTKKPESTENNRENRRGALKKIMTGGGIIVGAESLPTKWGTPEITSILLPAHAQTTDVDPTTTSLPQTTLFQTTPTPQTTT